MDLGDRTPFGQVLPEASGNCQRKYIGTVPSTGAVAQLKPPLRGFLRRVLCQFGEVAVYAPGIFVVDATEANSRLGDDEQPEAVVEHTPSQG
ncbi:hypothetical protein D3C86_647580 [compost metagenome]